MQENHKTLKNACNEKLVALQSGRLRTLWPFPGLAVGLGTSLYSRCFLRRPCCPVTRARGPQGSRWRLGSGVTGVEGHSSVRSRARRTERSTHKGREGGCQPSGLQSSPPGGQEAYQPVLRLPLSLPGRRWALWLLPGGAASLVPAALGSFPCQ